MLKAKYSVDNTRVGQQTDFDRLTLEVWTNGTITAKEAVSWSAKILTEHLKLFIDLSEDASSSEIMVEKSRRRKGQDP